MDRRLERKLREQVSTDFAFLFQDFGGQFVPNDRTDRNVVMVTVEAADLRVEVSQHHGDYGISVAKRDHLENHESLTSILEVIYEHERSGRKLSFVDLAELGALFRERFNQVRSAVSSEHYSDTVAAIDRNHHLGMQSMAEAFNRHDGYFDADLVSPKDLMKKAPK